MSAVTGDGLMSVGISVSPSKAALRLGRTIAILIQKFFCAGVIACGFDGQQFMRKFADRSFCDRKIYSEPPVFRCEGALVRQIIELERHSFTVRFIGPEPQRAETRKRETSCKVCVRCPPSPEEAYGRTCTAT